MNNSLLTLILAYLQVALIPQPVGLIAGVPEDDVALLLELEIPRRDQDDVTFSDPVPLLYLAADPAHPPVPVLTDDPHASKPVILVYDAQHVVSIGKHHTLPDVTLTLD